MGKARVEEHEGSLCINFEGKRYLPGPVNPFAFHYDQSPDGLKAGVNIFPCLKAGDFQDWPKPFFSVRVGSFLPPQAVFQPEG